MYHIVMRWIGFNIIGLDCIVEYNASKRYVVLDCTLEKHNLLNTDVREIVLCFLVLCCVATYHFVICCFVLCCVNYVRLYRIVVCCFTKGQNGVAKTESYYFAMRWIGLEWALLICIESLSRIVL